MPAMFSFNKARLKYYSNTSTFSLNFSNIQNRTHKSEEEEGVSRDHFESWASLGGPSCAAKAPSVETSYPYTKL